MTFIYGLVDPLSSQIRYIGKADNPAKRYFRHLRENIKNPRTHKECWIASLLKNNLKPILEIIEETDAASWVEREKYYIAYYKSKKVDLTNATDGGEDPPNATGRKISEEHKAILLSCNLGKKRSLETRQRISEAVKKNHVRYWKNKKFSKEHRNNLSIAKKGRRHTEEEKKNLSRPAYQYDKNGNFIKKWNSVKEAGKSLGKKHWGNISTAITGHIKTAYGFIWKREET
jgi:group I intron endonuclease